MLLALYLKASIHQKDRKYISSLRNNLINEFKPKTPSALLILDIAVSAYFRVMRSSAIYNALIQTPDGVVDWAGKKEGGWGEGIFARPRFSAAAEFRANKVGAPPFFTLDIAQFLYPLQNKMTINFVFLIKIQKFVMKSVVDQFS